MRYYIVDNEKLIIQQMLDDEFRNKVNFVIDDVRNNILDTKEMDKYKVGFRELEEITNAIEHTYSACKKQVLNTKSEIKEAKKFYGDKIELDALDKKETIYVPISLSKLNNIANKKKLNVFLEGTIGKFIAETKIYDDISDVVILKLKDVSQPYFVATDEYSDILARLITPSFKIILQQTDLNRINKLMIANVEARKNDNRVEKIRPIIEGTIKKTDVLKYDEDLEYIKEDKAKEKAEVEKVNANVDNDEENNNEKELDNTSNEFKNDIQQELDRRYNEILKSKNNEDKAKEEKKPDKEKVENKSIDSDDSKEVVVEELDQDNVEKILLFDEGTKQYNNFKEVIELEKIIQELYMELDHYLKSKEEFEDEIIKTKEEITAKEEEKEKIIVEIEKYKRKYITYLEKRFKIIDQKISKQTVEEIEEVNDLEIIKYMDVEKALRQNLNRISKIIDDVDSLIRKQQKFAKIGAETSVKYSAIVDAFKIKEESVKLKKEIKKMYDDFEKFYFNKVNKKVTDEKYEKKLGKILEAAIQVQNFLNAIYNPRTAKKRTNIDRFDELVMIEENELKRVICKTVENTIAEGNLLIIDDEVNKIENKPAYKKILDLITGNRKAEEYRQIKLEDATEDIQKKLEQVYTINSNYKIHDILAELMIFKAENIEDEMVEIYTSKLAEMEKGIGKNFVIDEDKVLEKIYELKTLNLPINIENATKEEEIDMEISLLYKKYGYIDIPEEAEVKYIDNTAEEIKQISDYIKVSI